MGRHVVKLLFLVLVLSCVGFKFVSSAPRMPLNGECTPPRGTVCIHIKKCPLFADLLNNSKIPRSHQVIKVIRDHQCGFEGNVPKVCCTLPKITTTEETPKGDIREPSAIEHHPNLELLPRGNCGRGPVSIGYRIISGSSSTLMEFPWMALLAYMTNNGLDFRCGGSVINERYILTAAHCIHHNTDDLTLMGVRLGEHNLNTEEDCDKIAGNCAPPVQDFYVEDVIVHPDYVPATFANDIALVRLATPANFSYPNVHPICLPLAKTDLILERNLGIVTGWGITEFGYKSDSLLKISIPVVPNEKCKLIYAEQTPITERQLCAGDYKGRDSCSGDSGGPLKQVGFVDGRSRYIQYGIVSYGPKRCGMEGRPGVYTRISYYLEWILDNIKA